MAFVIFTVICAIAFFGLLALAAWLIFDWGDPIGLLFILLAVVVGAIYWASTSNRDTSRDDTAVVTKVSILSDDSVTVNATQYNGSKVTAPCGLKPAEKCNDLRPGNIVTITTRYNSIGLVDTYEVTQVSTSVPQ